MILTLDFTSELPIYVQLRNEIVIGIGSGQLADGERLPTVRQMAEDLGINSMTVNKAYAILKNEGFISIDRRHGATVSPAASGQPEFKAKLENELRLVISEAALKGVGREEFMQLCTGIFAAVAYQPKPVFE
ncbi:GntR family transcriptional regulator [Paenibacillus sp. MMS20-IR301]|uniref:GntR family transcriptional regulator n=1 Tax=Paenibacillus sp. MMS20-IR301 TaxID=2895946 RepID=UPI0028F0C5AC|nr:GntR family transcriptional regulator [Paenibacillus sp. MMS20-IR301]WNS46266.1 GntR family transcriptional regulator [Paenibacillus sp. MMS20-IR301]